MKTKWKRLWIKALESGKYKQACNSLREGTGKDARYCCLGVLCKVVASAEKWRFNTFRKEHLYPPKSVLKMVSLQNRSVIKLAKLNDAGFNFKQIAAFIKKHY